MTQMAGPERQARTDQARTHVEETWRLSAAAAAALDQLDQATSADEAYDHYLERLHFLDDDVREGRLDLADLPARRTEIIDELRDAVLHTQPDPALTRLGDLWRGLDRTAWMDALYVPSGAAGAAVPVDHRYALHWTSADLPHLVQMKSASAESGRLHVVNLTDWTAHTASGYAQAAVGVLVRPKQRLARLTFRPEATYTFRHMIDTPSVPGTVPWSRACNRGQLRLVAQRVNPVTGAFTTDVQRCVQLWSDSATSGSTLFTDSGAGTYPGTDPGLSVIASSADTFALWFIAAVFVGKEDHYRTNRTVCQANLDCAVPAIWVEETPLR
jgi:hypothetical protein